MPYTPPASRSPAPSALSSPEVSRQPSLQTRGKPSLPRSASYLNKHRHTASVSAVQDGEISAPPIAPDAVSLTQRNTVVNLAQSLGHSPSATMAGCELSPNGIVASQSASNSDDASDTRGKQRGSTNDLRVAANQMPQARFALPSDTGPRRSQQNDPVENGAPSGMPNDRRIGHVRSATEPCTPKFKSNETSLTVSDEDTDEDLKSKPPIVRKKSGELVRPALRASHRRPSSVLGTPIFSKAVHFDSHLEHVWLSNDQKSMLGSVAVVNYAFKKLVTCRFTLDYWKTVSEVNAEYTYQIHSPLGTSVHDQFTFAIKLSDMANLESKTLFFCIRYIVDGKEFWDNNGSTNFQVDFRKKHMPQNGKNGVQSADSRALNGLPHSNRRPRMGNTVSPVSMPACLNSYGIEPRRLDFGQSINDYFDEPGPALRLKAKSSANLASDNIVNSLTPPSGAAFSHRYDFGVSLSAAMQAAKDSSNNARDGLYMKKNFRGFEPGFPGTQASGSHNGHHSPSPSLPSASYEEFVSKYCFFGSKIANPTNDGNLKRETLIKSTTGPDACHTGHNSNPAQVEGPPIAHCTNTPSQQLAGSSSYFSSFVTTSYKARQQRNTSFSLPVSMAPTRSPPSGLTARSGAPSEVSYHGQPQALAEWFNPWTTESQASATAILG